MNRCPQCHSEFADHLLYCLKDGQRLEPVGEAVSLSSAPRRLAELLDAETPMAVARAVRLVLALCDAVAGERDGHISGALQPQAISIVEAAGDEPPRVKIENRQSPATQAAADTD